MKLAERKNGLIGAGAGSNQKGAVLIVSMVMLLLLTIIGMSAVELTNMDTRIASNTKDRALAFDAAETALNMSGQVLAPSEPLPDSSTPGFLTSTMTDNWWHSEAETWWDTNATAVANYDGVASGLAYVIEQPTEIRTNGAGQQVADVTLGEPKPVTRFYRTTARGEGPGGTEVFVQSVYARKVYLNTAE
ncbi:pilus assembly PilX family protein [Marinobacter sp. OP 3.4]|uniref:pilus assembly PilX family protein n=1 Tax=Marinobacter sp. OP 3.4 TaxID=3076501 RepID=UPI002E205861